MQSKVYRLLGETPPNGGEFAKSVKRILGREEAWNRYFLKDVEFKHLWRTETIQVEEWWVSQPVKEDGGKWRKQFNQDWWGG